MKTKKVIYITLATILGILLSFILHAVIEILVLNNSNEIIWYTHFGRGLCALHPTISYGLWLMGIIGGFLLGRIWWRIVYIEKRHWRFNKKINNQKNENI